MDHHSAPERNERTTKWILDVATRSRKRTSWSAANVAFVATRRVGVGPGVNTLDQSSSTKEAMLFQVNDRRNKDESERRHMSVLGSFEVVDHCALSNAQCLHGYDEG